MPAELFAATIGQAPGAITLALDMLRLRHSTIDSVALLHTSPDFSGISEQFHDLTMTLANEYSDLRLFPQEIIRSNGLPLVDIVDEATSHDYFRGVWTVLQEFKQRGYRVHFLVAGGRKAMSIYAMLAATFALRSEDCVWTIHSPDSVIKARLYRLHQVPLELRDSVQLVRLPIFPLRLAPAAGDLRFDEIERWIEHRQNLGDDFLNKLSAKEREVASALRLNPYAENQEIGQHLFVNARTVETHLQNIYQKMRLYLDRGDQLEKRQMRQVLIDLLAGRL